MKAPICLSLCFCLLAIASHVHGQPAATARDGPEKDFAPAAPVARLGNERSKGLGRPFALIFSRDSKTLVVGGWEGDLVCWNLENRQLVKEWRAHSGGPIEALAVSPDGKALASGGDDKEIHIWQLATGERTHTLKGHRHEVEHLAFAPDGAHLASTDPFGVAIWELANPEEHLRLDRNLFEIGGAAAFTDASSLAVLAFANDGKPTMQSHNVKTGKQKARLDVSYQRGNKGALSPSGKWLVQIDRAVRITNLGAQSEMRYFAGEFFDIDSAYALTISPDDRYVAIPLFYRVVVVELATGRLCGEYRWPDQRHTCFAFSPDGRHLACGSADRSVLLWDLTGRQVNGKLPPVVLTAAELDRLWNDLTSGDGRVLQRVVWALSAGARDSVPYLEAKLRPVGAAPERIASLLRDLDDNNFKVRVRAETELEKLHDEAEAALKKVLSGGPDLETRRRIEKLLDLIETQWNKGQMIRGIEALERCGTAEARKALEELASNGFSLRRAHEAKAALRRLTIVNAGQLAALPWRFEVTVAENLLDKPQDGRLLIALGRSAKPEPRTRIGTGPGAPVVLGADVSLAPSGMCVIDEKAAIFPVESLGKLPPGDYFAQAILDVSRDLKLVNAPGNFYGDAVKIKINSSAGGTIKLELAHKVPPEEMPADTKDVKYVKLQSQLLSKFHGRPMFLRASLMLPRDFEKDADKRFPLRVSIGGFATRFTAIGGGKGGKGKGGVAADGPQFLRLLLDGAGPFGDPYQVNSANNGPYGDAITQELIPYVEKTYRGIGQPYARVLEGHSTGGWVSLALQIFYPDFFNGAWSSAPDPVDFRAYELINIYADDNAYLNRHGFERPSARDINGDTRITIRHEVQLERVLGRGDRWELGGRDWCSWNATFGPRGDDGYPKPLWDGKTGKIDRSVLDHWKKYDLRLTLEQNWSSLGPKLRGKLHIWVGEADDYFLNNAVHLLDDFLSKAQPPYEGKVTFAPRANHNYRGLSNQQLSAEMAAAIERGKQGGEERDNR